MAHADETYDFVIVGSGGSAVAAALVMKEAGKRALIIEKREFFGGSSALSGGVMWIPCNSLGREAGVQDTPEMAKAYLDACAGPESKGSSAARRAAFLDQAPKAIDFLRSKGMQLVHGEGYSDYHETEYPGGVARSRSVMPKIFDLDELGDKASWIDWTGEFPAMMTHETFHLTRFGRDWKSREIMLRVGWRMLQNKLLRRKLVGTGYSLQGRLLQIALKEKLDIWIDSPVTHLTSENGRVTGVVARREGKDVRVTARDGVLINAGGFARSAEMRKAWLEQPDSAEWTVSNKGDTGEVLQMAMDLGADVENMHMVWWVPGTFPPEGGTAIHVGEHARPHAIVVDSQGQRFVNEGTSYVEIGLAYYRHHKQVPCIPAWVIMDSRHRKYYSFHLAPPGKTPQHWLDSGFMKKADSVADLAGQCGLPADKLQATIERFNGFARAGVDGDFGRGGSAYARYIADPSSKPNAALGTLEQPPYYAVQLWPRDVGTCGGLVTDEHARVLDKASAVIPGLYATGNSTSSVNGPSYPGAGASIGASLTFGYAAARHAARSNA